MTRYRHIELTPSTLKARIAGKVLVVGFGALGQALLPLLLRHVVESPEQVEIVTADGSGSILAKVYDVAFSQCRLTPCNFASELSGRIGQGDWLINVSVNVSSLDLLDWCQARGVMYIDTCIEPWAGGYDAFERESATNAYLRHQALSRSGEDRPTAVVAHGANPGLISHLLREGLECMAIARGLARELSWAELARELGVKTIHIAERDTQKCPSNGTPTGVFTNTWSTSGLLAEAWQCAEMGWGSHEYALPDGGERYTSFQASGIRLNQHGGSVRVKSWVPLVGEQIALAISHHEALSIASLLTLRDSSGKVCYRPTVHYAYRPAPATFAMLQDMDWAVEDPQEVLAHGERGLVLRDELSTGVDQLGVLFVFDGGAFWYGSTLSLQQARSLAPYNSATTLQAVAGIVGAIAWMSANPNEGVVEAEQMDHGVVMSVARPYLGEVAGHWTTWQPGAKGELAFEEFLVKTEEMV